MFQFKQFSLDDSRCAMKIGTDGVLLGAWTTVDKSQSTLDIGTGSGIIALQLAQRCDAEQIDALEIDEYAYEQAVENFENSDWGDRLFCYHASFDEFVEELGGEDTYDTIVCNPPFYAEDYKTGDVSRDMARFQQALPFEELLQGVSILLSPNGNFSVIIPFSEEESFLNIASQHNLFPSRITHVKGHAEASVKRSLLELSKQKTTPKMDTLVIEISRHVYTSEYINLVKEFYLKM